MNNQEAKFILHAYRAGGQDAQDPQFAEALEQTKRDPELAEWFARERALDAAIGQKVKTVPVPAELKAAILAGAKVIRPTVFWRRTEVLAWAAAIVLFAGLASRLLWPAGPVPLASYRSEMASFLSTRLDFLDLETPDPMKVKQWLTKQKSHGDFALTPGLQSLPSVGCRVLKWKGKRVSLICFHTQENQEVHLFVINRADLQDPPPANAHQFATAGDWLTASWTQGDKTYLLAGAGDRTFLKKYL